VNADPDIRYANAGRGRIAYEVLGDGPIDLLLCNEITMVSIDSIPGDPHWEGFDRKLASFARLIRFDRRGMGLSDGPPVGSQLSVDQFAEDALAVLDAAGSSRAAVFGMAGGPPSPCARWRLSE
jgi:pimeloyl-ACP methyl ester carboxylesterase